MAESLEGKKYAILFPGQGAYSPEHLMQVIVENQDLAKIFKNVLNKPNLFEDIKSSKDLFFKNENYSLGILLLNHHYLKLLTEKLATQPFAYAGYSIGQWSALVASDTISLEKAIELVSARARMMNQSIKKYPSGMIAVLGLQVKSIMELITQSNFSENEVFISNINCPGNVSISGQNQPLEDFKNQLKTLEPKQIVDLDVSGAWHSPLLTEASNSFGELLSRAPIPVPTQRIYENISGKLFQSNTSAFNNQLALHLSSPVQWQSTITNIIADGVEAFVEPGPSRMLEKFGFFINREIPFIPGAI